MPFCLSSRTALAERVGEHLVQLRAVLENGQTGRQQAARGPRAEAGRLQGGAVRLLGQLWPRGWVGTWPQLRAVRRTARRPISGPSRRQRDRMLGRAGQLQGGALCLPGRLWPRGWAGIWSRLRAVSRTARRADSGSPEGHGPDAGQGPGSSGAVRCGALGGPCRVDRRHLVTAPGGQENGQTAHQWAGLRATGRMLGRGRAAPGRCAVPPWGGSGRASGHLVAAPDSQEAGQTAHRRAW